MKIKISILLLLSLVLSFTSCKKDEEDDHSECLTTDDLFYSEGTCKTSIKGQTENGYNLDENVNFNVTQNPTFIDKSNSNIFSDNFNILFKIDRYTSDLNNLNGLNFSILYNPDEETATVESFYLSYSKIIDSKNIVSISEHFYTMPIFMESIDLENFVYNEDNATISGDITYTKQHDTVETLTITTNFELPVKNVL